MPYTLRSDRSTPTAFVRVSGVGRAHLPTLSKNIRPAERMNRQNLTGCEACPTVPTEKARRLLFGQYNYIVHRHRCQPTSAVFGSTQKNPPSTARKVILPTQKPGAGSHRATLLPVEWAYFSVFLGCNDMKSEENYSFKRNCKQKYLPDITAEKQEIKHGENA